MPFQLRTDHNLLRFGQHPLQGFHIQTLFRNLAGFLILFKDRKEFGGLALRTNLPLRLVCFSSPQHLCRLTTRLGDHILLIAAGLIDEAFAVFASPYDLMEGILDLLGRVNTSTRSIGRGQW